MILGGPRRPRAVLAGHGVVDDQARTVFKSEKRPQRFQREMMIRFLKPINSQLKATR